MRIIFFLILGAGWGAWAAEEFRVPPAQLLIADGHHVTEVPGQMTVELVDRESPTCAMVLAREKYLEKQIREIESSSDRGETAELVELRRRLLQLKGMLARPWVRLSARFSVRENVTQALAKRRAGIAFEISSRTWSSPQGYLPEDVQLKADGENQLLFDWMWDASQYCKWTSGLTLKIEIAAANDEE